MCLVCTLLKYCFAIKGCPLMGFGDVMVLTKQSLILPGCRDSSGVVQANFLPAIVILTCYVPCACLHGSLACDLYA